MYNPAGHVIHQITKYIHIYSPKQPSIHSVSVHWIEAAVICLKDQKNTISWSQVNQNLTVMIFSSYSSRHLPSVIPHSQSQHARFQFVSQLCVLSVSQVVVSFIVCQCFYLVLKDVYVYGDVHVLNYMSSGAVYIHSWCHTRGLSMWRNSHTSLRVQSCVLWADPYRLADQLVTSEGRVPGKPNCNLDLEPLKCHFSRCLCRNFTVFFPSRRTDAANSYHLQCINTKQISKCLSIQHLSCRFSNMLINWSASQSTPGLSQILNPKIYPLVATQKQQSETIKNNVISTTCMFK